MGLNKKELNKTKYSEVEIIGFSETKKDDKEICMLKVKDGKNTFDIGLFDCADEILETHGTAKDGKNFLSIPESKIKEEGTVWFNHCY